MGTRNRDIEGRPRNARGQVDWGGQVEAVRVVYELLAEQRIIRPRDLERRMGSAWWIKNLIRWGDLREAAPGLFVSPTWKPAPTLLALARAPKAILGLTSALWAHGILSPEPSPIHILLPRGSRRPRSDVPPICATFVSDLGPREQFNHSGLKIPASTIPRALIDCLRLQCGPSDEKVFKYVVTILGAGLTTPGQLAGQAKEVNAPPRVRSVIGDAIASWREGGSTRPATPP